MSFFGSFYGGSSGGGGSPLPTFPVIANAATQETIRDRCYTLIEALTPTLLASDKFRRYRNELGADFTEWAQKNPAAAWRRFQIREVGDDAPPDGTNTNIEIVELELEIRIAYPQNHRAGPANAMDRDDVLNADWLAVNYAVGIYGRGNFSGTNDCTPLGATKGREQSGAIDFLVVRARFRYWRATT